MEDRARLPDRLVEAEAAHAGPVGVHVHDAEGRRDLRDHLRAVLAEEGLVEGDGEELL